MANLKTNSVNDVKNTKAVQSVTREELMDIFCGIEKDIKAFGGLWEIMKITKRFAYTLTDVRQGYDLPVIKVGDKSFYLSPVGQVNKMNVLNVIKSILKIQDAKRVLAKKQAKRLSFEDFCSTKDVEQKLNLLLEGARMTGSELTDQQVKTAKHRLYEDYLKSLGLEE
jgi:hypothetical protein|nr:MAG TPA: hypothetical protein [Caudoviricetes sp.]